MNELYALGELMTRPLHGYLLHNILNRTVGPIRQISWGTLYPLIRRLEKEGFIEQVQDDELTGGRGKKKKTYQITEEGKTQFYRLMEEPIPYSSDYELHFHIKMGNFSQVTEDVKLIILHQYKDFLRFNHRHIQEHKNYVEETDEIPGTEVPYIVSIHEHILMQTELNESWVEKQIQKVKRAMGG